MMRAIRIFPAFLGGSSAVGLPVLRLVAGSASARLRVAADA